MALYEKKGEALVITMFDLSKYFDRENIYDCCNELYRSQVRGKVYRLLFSLNKNSKIRVRTPVGDSQSAETGPCLTQGSVEGAVWSAVNLDNGVKDFFHGEPENNEPESDSAEIIEDVKYGEVEIKPLLFQDDVANTANSLKAAQLANTRMEELIDSKSLLLNLDKCCFLVAGGKKARVKMSKEVANSPLILCNREIKQVESNKYLGCYLAQTVSDSISVTVSNRIGLASRSIYEIRAIIEDSRSQSLGSVEVGINLWEMTVIPMLYYSCEVFYETPAKTIKMLDQVTGLFLANLFGVSKRGCPTVSLFLETSTLLATNRILLQKLLFYHHVVTLPEDSLAGEIYRETRKNENKNNIIEECEKILCEWNIYDVASYSKWSWRKTIKSQIKKKNDQDLLTWSLSYKKVDTIKYETKPLKLNPT